MNALSKLITKCTKRQFQIASTVDEISAILDRTISFSESGKLSDEQVESLIPYVPVTEPEVVAE